MLYLKQAAGVMLLALAIPAHPQSQSESPQSQAPPPVVARINVLIVREANGKPVKNAEVVLHQVGKDGKQKQEGLELKTHEDGKAEATGIPFGKVRIQVIAHGFRTFGDDFEITQPTQDITIKLQKPKEQFSIYK
jgi:hypothetical protein